MKSKFMLLCSAAVFMTVFTYAQGFQLGIKAGADMDKISGKSFKDEFNFGYHLGAYTSIPLSKKMALQPEIYYSSVNMRRDTSISNIFSPSISNIRLGYLNIPVLLSFKAGEKLNFLIGPKFGILSNSTNSVLTNAKNAFKNGDLAMVAGFQLNFSGINIYGRYNVGLLDINDLAEKDKWTRQTIHIGVGFKII